MQQIEVLVHGRDSGNGEYNKDVMIACQGFKLNKQERFINVFFYFCAMDNAKNVCV